MDDSTIIIGFVSLFIFTLIYFSFKKTEKEKAITREEKRKENLRKHQEHRRLEVIRHKKETKRIAQLERDRERNKELILKGKLIANKIGKVVNDSTNKLRKDLMSSINKHYLTSFSWVMVTNSQDYIMFTFKDNNELLITENGSVEKGSYEMLGQNKSLLISRDESTKHFYFININNDFFFLNKVSTSEVYAFVNHNKFDNNQKKWFLKEVNRIKLEMKK